MGNEVGFIESIAYYGQNERIEFDGGCFSFALGDEIALILEDNPEDCFILNCTEELWKEVKEKVKSKANKADLIKFWIKKSKEYEISDWSRDFKFLELK